MRRDRKMVPDICNRQERHMKDGSTRESVHVQRDEGTDGRPAGRQQDDQGGVYSFEDGEGSFTIRNHRFY